MYIHVYIYIYVYIYVYTFILDHMTVLYTQLFDLFCPIQILPYCIYPYPYCMLLLWSNNSKIGQKNAKKKFFSVFQQIHP